MDSFSGKFGSSLPKQSANLPQASTSIKEITVDVLNEATCTLSREIQDRVVEFVATICTNFDDNPRHALVLAKLLTLIIEHFFPTYEWTVLVSLIAMVETPNCVLLRHGNKYISVTQLPAVDSESRIPPWRRNASHTRPRFARGRSRRGQRGQGNAH